MWRDPRDNWVQRPCPTLAQHRTALTAFFFSVAGALVGAVWVTGVFAEELRDPFMFGSRTDAAHPRTGPVLIGVLWDATHPLAIVGDETVRVGDTVGDWRVTKIQQDGIVVEREDRRTFVTPGNALPTD